MAGYKKRDGNVYQLDIDYYEDENEKNRGDIPDKTRLRFRNLINLHPFRGIDYSILVLVIILVMFGLVMVFSSSYYYAMTNAKFDYNKFFFFSKQLRAAIIGFGAMIACMVINPHVFRKFALPAYVVIVAVLGAVLVIGVATKGSVRWLNVLGTSLQPSEFAKFVIIIFMSSYMIKYRKYVNGNFKMFILASLPALAVTLLVAKENLSTGIVIMAIALAIMFVASKKIINFVVFGIMGFLGFVGLVLMEDYRRARIVGWLNPFGTGTDEGFQIIQSLYAIASGGLFGLGLGQSRQKTFVPEGYNDIIFAIICEELGLVGAVIIIALYALLLWRGIKIAMTAKDKFSAYAATGITMMIGIQVVINIAVVTNSIPNTGMPLPFISYGGTALVVMLASVGLLLNISRNCKR